MLHTIRTSTSSIITGRTSSIPLFKANPNDAYKYLLHSAWSFPFIINVINVFNGCNSFMMCRRSNNWRKIFVAILLIPPDAVLDNLDTAWANCSSVMRIRSVQLCCRMEC
eukprot:29763_1